MNAKRILSAALALVMLVCLIGAAPARAEEQQELVPVYTYEDGEHIFEKVSHVNTPLGAPDGIIDYLGGGKVAPYVDGVSEPGRGDRGQSYSYASCTYGDWVYINTMYGGLGITSILGYGLAGLDAETVRAVMDVMYNGHLYYGEPDGYQAGGVLLKFNVKTGETGILMSRELNGLVPTFRNACVMGDKMYFVGMVVDTSTMSEQEVNMAIAKQDGQPCLYEVDPATDTFKCVYQCVDMDGYRELVANNIFPSTRAVGVFRDHLVTGGIEAEGSFIAISADPGAGDESFVRIAEMEDLFDYPAFHRTDVNAGGGIYQVLEFNDSLYVVVCSGSADTLNDKGTLRSFALIRGDCEGDPTEKESWTWTAVVGDQENDGARYTFGIDPTRISCGACTLEVYGDHLYIGDYNDVSNALQNFILKKSFRTQATNLEQSINLYRMDADENIELVVGDATEMFPEGSLSGLGSGYETHMSQYTWQTVVYEGKLYVSTMDTTTLLTPIAQFTNGELINMSREEWDRLVNYVQVLLELVMGTDAADAQSMIRGAIISAENRMGSEITLTGEQKAQLTQEIEDGTADEGVPPEAAEVLIRINELLLELSERFESGDHEEFAEMYAQAMELLASVEPYIPESMKGVYNLLLSFATYDNFEAIIDSIEYMESSVAGFDLYEIEELDDGSVTVRTVTNNGFGDRFNHGLRIFAKTTDYLLIGTANPFYGTQLWRRANAATDDFVNPFIDVHEGDYFYDPVMWAVEEGITTGTTPITFSPNDPCLRGQALTFLWRAMGCPEPETTGNPFVDVEETDFFYKAVLWAVENGITKGVSDTEFAPYAVCNRAHVVTFLHRALGMPGAEAAENPFTDVREGDFYYEAVLWAVENGVTEGVTADTFAPADDCLRAHVVTFLYRALAE